MPGTGLTGQKLALATVHAQLETHMPAMLAALFPDSEPIAKFLRGEHDESAISLPAVEVLPAPSTVVEDNINYLGMEHRVAIGVYVSDADPESLTDKMLDYARAVVETLAARRKVGAFGVAPLQGLRFAPATWDYTPTRTDGDNYLRDAFIEVVVRSKETLV